MEFNAGQGFKENKHTYSLNFSHLEMNMDSNWPLFWFKVTPSTTATTITNRRTADTLRSRRRRLLRFLSGTPVSSGSMYKCQNVPGLLWTSDGLAAAVCCHSRLCLHVYLWRRTHGGSAAVQSGASYVLLSEDSREGQGGATNRVNVLQRNVILHLHI